MAIEKRELTWGRVAAELVILSAIAWMIYTVTGQNATDARLYQVGSGTLLVISLFTSTLLAFAPFLPVLLVAAGVTRLNKGRVDWRGAYRAAFVVTSVWIVLMAIGTMRSG